MQIAEVEAAIRDVEAQIDKVKIEIKECGSEIEECESNEANCEDQKEKADIREEGRQLRDKKRQLLEKERQLRDEKFKLRDIEDKLHRYERARLDDQGTRTRAEPVSEADWQSNGVMIHAARIAFEAPYRDSLGVVHTLIKAMQKCRQSWQTCEDPHEKLYAPYMAVVQGSMMGKTRMFFTLHQHEKYVFYICLRADGSYPTGIPEVIQALTSETCTEGYYAAFILNALKALNDFKSKQDGSMSTRDSCFKWFELQQNLSFWKPILGEKI